MSPEESLLVAVPALTGGAIALWGLFSLWRRIRRRERWIAEAPFPERWRAILRRQVPAWHRLPDDLRRHHEAAVKRFLAEKRFVPCGGLRAVTDEMALTIAGHACLLVMGRPEGGVFPRLDAVLVYPDSFYYPGEAREAGPEGVRSEGGEHRVGESSQHGTVALSWLEIRNNIALSGNGRNVILHEFAHQLDGEDTAVDGTPALPDTASRLAWRRDMGAAYAQLRHAGEHGVLDPYGAREPAELFAVAVEAFFEDAAAFRATHPDLHSHLQKYFRVTPSAW